jgi:hypothetical protein
MRALVVIALCSGCGFDRVAGDGGALDGALDGAMGDAPIAAGDGGTPCAAPALLIAMGTPASGAAGGGAIVRFSLDPITGIATRCSTLRDSGNLPLDVRALATAGSDVAIAAGSTILLLDGTNDAERWRYVPTITATPIDVFLINADRAYVGVGSNVNVSGGIIDRADLYADGSGPAYHWPLDGASQPIGTVIGLTASARSPSRAFALTAGTAPFAATDWDPLAKTATPYADYPSGADLRTISTVAGAKGTRTVWVDANSNAVRFADDSGATTVTQGPSSYCDSTCKLLDVVPDPTDAQQVIALCLPVAGRRTVVRFPVVGGTLCTALYDGLDFDPAIVPTRLAVSP